MSKYKGKCKDLKEHVYNVDLPGSNQLIGSCSKQITDCVYLKATRCLGLVFSNKLAPQLSQIQILNREGHK